MKKKTKIIPYKLLLLSLIVCTLIGFICYTFNLKSQKLDEDGLAIVLNVSFDKKIDNAVAFYLKKENGDRIDLIRINNSRPAQFEELYLMKDKLTLFASVNGEELTLIKNMNTVSKEEYTIHCDVQDKKNRIGIETNYTKSTYIDFKKYEQDAKQVDQVHTE